jgi:enoyl-CoA hydratase
MATYTNLLLNKENSILTITINREAKLNALNKDTINELKNAFLEVMDDKSIRGVILTGAGEKAFVAGADISEFASVNEMHARKLSEEGQVVFKMIEDCHTPVIAVVHGFALGGGCELAMACHMRIASETSRFGQPEVNLGLIPGYGGTQRLTQLIGKGRALEYSMTADMIPAAKALEWGLVNYVEVDKAAAMAKANEILGKIAQKAPIAVGFIVDCVNAVFTPEDGYQTEANAFARLCGTSDFKEGVDAFMNKRQANFKGE